MIIAKIVKKHSTLLRLFTWKSSRRQYIWRTNCISNFIKFLSLAFEVKNLCHIHTYRETDLQTHRQNLYKQVFRIPWPLKAVNLLKIRIQIYLRMHYIIFLKIDESIIRFTEKKCYFLRLWCIKYYSMIVYTLKIETTFVSISQNTYFDTLF